MKYFKDQTGFNVIDMLKKHWAKNGTASKPLRFVDTGSGEVLAATGRFLDQDDCTVIYVSLVDD